MKEKESPVMKPIVIDEGTTYHPEVEIMEKKEIPEQLQKNKNPAMLKYAVVENGRNQLLVELEDTVLVDGQGLAEGEPYIWDKVLLVKDGDDVQIGSPYLNGVTVKGKIVRPVKGKKVVNFKKKRRKGYTRKVGHRQKFTEVIVEEIK